MHLVLNQTFCHLFEKQFSASLNCPLIPSVIKYISSIIQQHLIFSNLNAQEGKEKSNFKRRVLYVF